MQMLFKERFHLLRC